MKYTLTYLLLMISICVFAQRKSKTENSRKYVKGSYIEGVVVFKVKSQFRSSINARLGNSLLKNIETKFLATNCQNRFNGNSSILRKSNTSNNISDIYKLNYSTKFEIEDIIRDLYQSGIVEYAEPLFVSNVFYQPNDPQADSVSGSQWHLKSIKAFEAWNDVANRGDSSVVVGVVDTGDWWEHTDLQSSVKINEGEDGLDGNGNSKRTNGKDDDSDGFVDNYRGWDLADDDNEPKADDSKKHGVMVAGLAAAKGDNNLFGIGTGFNCKFLPIKSSNNGNAAGTIVKGFEGIEYAVNHGAKVVNLSWGHYEYSQAEQDFINFCVKDLDVLIVAAAGNTNTEKMFYPASYDNVLSVTHLTVSDQKETAGNYNLKIDISAPGSGVTSTSPDGNGNSSMATRSGSSFATPIVAGAAAALRAKYPSLKALQIGEILRTSSDIIDTMAINSAYIGKMGRGKLNMYKAFQGINTISIRYDTISALNTKGKSPLKGDTVLLKVNFVNYLLPANNVSIKLNVLNGKGILIDSIFNVGNLVTLENKELVYKFVLSNKTNYDENILFRFDYVAQNYSESEFAYKFLNIYKGAPFVDIDNGLVSMSIGNFGHIGYVYSAGNYDINTIGNGWNYKGNYNVYESGIMVGVSSKNVSSNVRGWGVMPTDFVTRDTLSSVLDTRFDHLFTGRITDEGSPENVGVEILQKAYSWNKTSLSKSVILELRVKNISDNNYDSVAVSYFNDIDAGYWENNKAYYDAVKKHIYVYNPLDGNAPYIGLRLLTNQKNNVYAFDVFPNISVYGVPNNINITNGGYLDSDKYKTMSSGVLRPEAGKYTSNGVTLNPNGNDVAVTFGGTLYNLPKGATQTIAFAFIVGDNLADFEKQSDSIYAQFNKVNTSPLPQVAIVSACKNSSAKVAPNNGSKFNFFKNQADVNALVNGKDYSVNTLLSDTVIWVSNTDSLYESAKVKADVKVANLVPDFTFIEDVLNQGQVNFVGTGNNITNWVWNFGDSQVGSGQNISNTYSQLGNYDVKLVVSNALSCRDSITKSVPVTNILTGLNNTSLTKLSIYPNPANERLSFTNSTNTLINVELKDISGRLLKTTIVNANGGYASIDVSEFNSGVYFVSYKEGNFLKTEKISIVK